MKNKTRIRVLMGLVVLAALFVPSLVYHSAGNVADPTFWGGYTGGLISATAALGALILLHEYGLENREAARSQIVMDPKWFGKAALYQELLRLFSSEEYREYLDHVSVLPDLSVAREMIDKIGLSKFSRLYDADPFGEKLFTMDAQYKKSRHALSDCQEEVVDFRKAFNLNLKTYASKAVYDAFDTWCNEVVFLFDNYGVREVDDMIAKVRATDDIDQLRPILDTLDINPRVHDTGRVARIKASATTIKQHIADELDIDSTVFEGTLPSQVALYDIFLSSTEGI